MRLVRQNIRRKKKKYSNQLGTFIYRDVPSHIYPYGINIFNENEYSYAMATPEKALCDKLYTLKSVKNKNLANTTLALRVEGSARKKGDSVNAVFSNIKLKDHTYSADKVWGTHAFLTNKGMKADVSGFSTVGRIAIKGTVKGISSSQDWDSAYDKVSGIIQFT